MPRFSCVIPVYSEKEPSGVNPLHFRGKTVQRAIKSILNQQYPDWELILVDDGCTDGITPQILDKFAESDKRIKVLHTPSGNRAIARNKGMEAATGEWITWLDSDDEYSTNYFRQLDKAITEFPEYKVFNFGSIIHHPNHNTSIRPVFEPAIEGAGHEWFRSGHIGTGSFIFRRDLWANNPEKYRIPDEASPYHFAAASGFDMKFDPDRKDIENPAGAFTDKVRRHGVSLGNPWGCDFFQYYLLTRDNHSKPLGALLYVQYPRSSENDYKHFGEIYDTD
jgi:glycosyltransferase involved in cell wall biosynthesis